MNTTPFLTRLDPTLEVKGSRDALGFIPIWSHFGREVVGNLSTITNSARQFTTLILGSYFARELINRHTAEDDEFLALFLKFEQVAAYSRYAWRRETGCRESDIRGIRLVSRNAQAGHGITIAANQTGQILSNQKRLFANIEARVKVL